MHIICTEIIYKDFSCTITNLGDAVISKNRQSCVFYGVRKMRQMNLGRYMNTDGSSEEESFDILYVEDLTDDLRYK